MLVISKVIINIAVAYVFTAEAFRRKEETL